MNPLATSRRSLSLVVSLLMFLTAVCMYVSPPVGAAEPPAGWKDVGEGAVQVYCVPADVDVADELATALNARWNTIQGLLTLSDQKLVVYLHPSFAELDETLQTSNRRAGWGSDGAVHLASVPGTRQALLLLTVQQVVERSMAPASGEATTTVPGWFQLGLTGWLLGRGDHNPPPQSALKREIADPSLRSTTLDEVEQDINVLSGFLEFVVKRYGQVNFTEFVGDLIGRSGSSSTTFDVSFAGYFDKTPADVENEWITWSRRFQKPPATSAVLFGIGGFVVFVLAMRRARRRVLRPA